MGTLLAFFVKSSKFLHHRFPGTPDAVFHCLIGRAFLRVHRQDAVGLFPRSRGNFETVPDTDVRYFQDIVHIFDISFHLRDQIFGRLYAPHLQCGT
jgi:hypothetical protein